MTLSPDYIEEIEEGKDDVVEIKESRKQSEN